MPQTDVVAALRTLAALFLAYRDEGHARFVEDLAERKESGDPTFAGRLGSIDVWGGSGAVWEANLDPSHRSATHAEDEHRFRMAIITLARHLDEQGIGSATVRERARFIAATLRS